MEEEDEEDSPEEPEIAEIEEEDLEKALSVERFSNILTYSGATGADRMGRHYTEKDFECRKKFNINVQLFSSNVASDHVCVCTVMNFFFFVLFLTQTTDTHFTTPTTLCPPTYPRPSVCGKGCTARTEDAKRKRRKKRLLYRLQTLHRPSMRWMKKRWSLRPMDWGQQPV